MGMTRSRGKTHMRAMLSPPQMHEVKLERTCKRPHPHVQEENTVKIDELLRRFDFYALSVKSLQAQDDYTKAALRAYAAGVNAWLEKVNEGARGRGAPEFWLFEPAIAPWQPAACAFALAARARRIPTNALRTTDKSATRMSSTACAR